MSSSFRSCLAIAALILIVTAAPLAKADTYQFTVVDHTQTAGFFGIDDNGDFVINDSGPTNVGKCGQINGNCFEVFLVGQSPFFTTSTPVLAFDNGATCSIGLDASFAPQTTASGICNNGHEIFGITQPVPDIRGIYDGPGLSDLIAAGPSFDGGFINANGDAVFIDGHDDELIFAQDLTTTTPEPSSLYLLGTGCLAMLGTLRRYSRSA